MPLEIEALPYEAGFILIGTEPFAVNDRNELIQLVQTFFISQKAYITVPGTHADQRLVFIDYLNQERARNQQPELSSSECDDIMDDAVSIAVQVAPEAKDTVIAIRIDCNLPRAERARKVLSAIIPEDQIVLV